jgi:hypothetical protein
MLRGSVSMLAGVAMLASQFASLPHAHGNEGGFDASSRAAMPHVHLAISDSHRHEHQDDAGHHHHHEQPSAQRKMPPKDGPIPAHDSDAVSLHPFLLTTQVETQAAANDHQVTGRVNDLASAAASSRVSTLLLTAWHLPPPRLRLNCPLYLGVQNLLL